MYLDKQLKVILADYSGNYGCDRKKQLVKSGLLCFVHLFGFVQKYPTYIITWSVNYVLEKVNSVVRGSNIKNVTGWIIRRKLEKI